ncbi:MAG: HAD family phosphatase [Ardenticatenaceae bacterium]|nr:HAD family phosphatase [Anaerolineales bacterium]MCB8922416.1 HAD family phosphatase [Ardenticatenaceae bacterium]MCB8991348.1 HAD family phosphatase [Ardenticatenaceae bacterium]MCB9005570.1 HAD family phosphatase [Ardenticatenaceae bacterium]
MTYKGIIFDFNGVLLWDSHLHEQAWAEFARQVRDEPFTVEEMRVQMHGRSNHAILEYLTGQTLDYTAAHKLGQQKEAIYRQMCLDLGDGFQLSPSAVSLLDWLVAHDVPHTIATASEAINLAFFVQHLNLARWFKVDKIIFDDGTMPNKPAPDIYLNAAAALGLAPAECIVVEDSYSGIQAAHAAGIGYIIALGPAPSHVKLRTLAGVKQTVVHLGEVQTAVLFPS